MRDDPHEGPVVAHESREIDEVNDRHPQREYPDVLQHLRFGRISILEHQHVVPKFTLGRTTVIEEIGGFVNCATNTDNGLACPNSVPFIEVTATAAGLPDPNAVIATYDLSGETDPLTTESEFVRLHLRLMVGTYFALFAPRTPDDAGFILGAKQNR